MTAVIILVFITGYLAITLEHNLKVDKLIPALIMMSMCWAFVALGIDDFPEWFDSAKHTLLDFTGFAHDEKIAFNGRNPITSFRENSRNISIPYGGYDHC